MKEISVVSPGASTAFDIEIGPGTLVKDVIEKVGLSTDKHTLILGQNKPPLDPNQDIYKLVENHQKIYVIADPRAGVSTPAPQIRIIETRPLMMPIDTGTQQHKPEGLLHTLLDLMGIRKDRPTRYSNSGLRHSPDSTTNNQLMQNDVFQNIANVMPHVSLGKLKRKDKSLWQEKGWRRRGKHYYGDYITSYGAYRGEIIAEGRKNHKICIYSPPNQIEKHPHGECLMHQGGGKFYLHLIDKCPDVGSCIVKMENMIHESYQY